MYVLRREDRTYPFAVVTDTTDKLKKAITNELEMESVEFKDKVPDLEYGEIFFLKCDVIDEDGSIYDWEIEIVKVLSY